MFWERSGMYRAAISCALLAEAQKAQEGQSGQQPAGKAIAAHPPRATDAFYAKLLPALEVSLHFQPLTAFSHQYAHLNTRKHLQVCEEPQFRVYCCSPSHTCGVLLGLSCKCDLQKTVGGLGSNLNLS